MKKLIYLLLIASVCLAVLNCNLSTTDDLKKNKKMKREELVYHYSLLDALRNGVYSGDVDVAELSTKGDFGLGTYNYLDGEMVVVDGVFYRVDDKGLVTKAESKHIVPFAAITFFKESKIFEINYKGDLEGLHKEILKFIPSKNRPYAVRIDCVFESIKVGAAYKVKESEKRGLSELMKTRPIYEKNDVSGSMIGFYTPDYASGVDLSPLHFHFISDERKFGGHLLSGKVSSLKKKKIKIRIAEKAGYEIILPRSNKKFNETWQLNDGAKSSY